MARASSASLSALKGPLPPGLGGGTLPFNDPAPHCSKAKAACSFTRASGACNSSTSAATAASAWRRASVAMVS
jgi:hypothetical protein